MQTHESRWYGMRREKKKALLEEPLLLDIKETYYKGKIRPYGKTKRAPH
jgi:hypothetical protein